MNTHSSGWVGRVLEGVKVVSSDFGTVLLGVAVVFFTRSFISDYLDNVNFVMLAASLAFCLIGLALRFYSQREATDQDI